MASYQYVYHMDGVTKAYGSKKVFENIRLSFLPGVKIGVVGVNGSGKSTLMRIMAGQDKDFQGEAWAAKGAKVGYLPQEPALDETKDVRGNVMEGVAAKQALVTRFNEVAMKVAEDYSDELMEEMTSLQDQIDAQNLWDLDAQVDIAMEALRCPPDSADVKTLSGGEKRRVALCKLLLEAPEMLLLDEPTNHLDAETILWLQKHLIEYPGTVLIITHDRYFLDEITPGPGRAVGGQLFLMAGAEGQAAGAGGARGQIAPAHPVARTGMDQAKPPRPAGQIEGAGQLV
jgi:ATPase subunit of ABC transporter with duplicated ATPase domains